ncbi:MAG: ferritin-like domain-containing protein [Burkholderiales bacterium]
MQQVRWSGAGRRTAHHFLPFASRPSWRQAPLRPITKGEIMLGHFLTRAHLQEIAARRLEKQSARRDFMRRASGFAVGVAGGAVVAACGGGGGDANAQSNAPSDADILNFALNLEYLEAQFYQYAAFGTGLPDAQLPGPQGRGTLTPGRAVAFSDPVVRQYAKEIAQDEAAHVKFLRTALGGSAVAMPSIDIGTDPNGAFSSAARAAGLVGPGQSFDPYASDENFLLAAFIFEDVGVTAYKGASPLISNKTYLEAAAGILAAEAYHAGLIRSTLYAKGVAAPSLRTAADAISNARDSLDNSQDDDQGISPNGDVSNIAPLDGNGIAYSRTPGDVLNIVFLNAGAVSKGGFFPAGVNGSLALSSAM